MIDTMLPRVRITELLHEGSRRTRFSAAFTNLRTGEACDNEGVTYYSRPTTPARAGARACRRMA